MTITVNLPPALLAMVQADAEATGKDVDTFVREAVEAKLATRKRTLAEILKPIHDAVEASGMIDEQINELLDRELTAHRNEKRLPFPKVEN